MAAPRTRTAARINRKLRIEFLSKTGDRRRGIRVGIRVEDTARRGRDAKRRSPPPLAGALFRRHCRARRPQSTAREANSRGLGWPDSYRYANRLDRIRA